MAERSHKTRRPTPYRLDTVLGKVEAVHLMDGWLVFFRSNYIPLRAFAQLSLAKYLEVRNPGNPAIINKLQLSQERDLLLVANFGTSFKPTLIYSAFIRNCLSRADMTLIIFSRGVSSLTI
ncbi:MAG: hypothetical protein JO076_01465 [Verrucomicrobia bacterium]|nr:hypothetical protein [Verrucomicrobiota bacterium]